VLKSTVLGPPGDHLHPANRLDRLLETTAGAKFATSETARLVAGPFRTPSKSTPVTSMWTPVMVATEFPPDHVRIHETSQHLAEQGAQGKGAGEG
jgi:hypothetical protein